MLIKILSSLFAILSFAIPAYCQYSFKQEINFVEHLNGLKTYDDALFHLRALKSSNQGQSDTVSFWQGKLFYQKKSLAQSVNAFNQVSGTVRPLYRQARFQSSLQLAYLNLYDSAYHHLDNYSAVDELYQGLQYFQLASIGLLKRDFDVYEKNANNFNGLYYAFKDYESDLTGIHDLIKNRKTKSPLLAGMMSAVIPGSGKIYAGKIGQGAMSLLISGIFGLQTWESYRKDGVKSPRFIIFGSLFSAFYVANVWGSVVTVKMTEIEFNDSANEAILVNMHVPLRVIFD